MTGQLIVISGLPGVGKSSVAERLAARTGSVHLSVDVVDAVNDSEEARQTWRAAASSTGSRIDFVHLVLSDAQEHERRLSGRERGLAFVGEPTWADVQRRRAEYAEWSDEILQLETSARTVDEVVDGTLW